jgi:hypothetical protein
VTEVWALGVPAGVGGRVLDTAALVELAYGRTLFAQAFTRLAVDRVIPLAIPSTALALAWAALDGKARLRLAVVTELSVTVFESLGAVAAGRVGEVLAETPAFSLDVCAGHVAEIASRRGWPCVTDRGPVLRAIVPGLEIEPLP